MATCENCGTSFDLSQQATEVTSLRILCSKCEAERRAKKQQKLASAAPVPPPVSKPTPRAAAAAAPGTKAPAANATAPAARPPVNRVAHEGAKRASEAKPAPVAKPAEALNHVKPAASVTPAPAKTRPATKRTAAKSDATEKPGRSRDVQREFESLKEKESKTVMIGWIAAIVMIVGAGVTSLLAYNKNQREEEEAARYENRRKEIHATAMAMPLETEEAAKAMVDFLDSSENVDWWQKDIDDSRKSDLINRRAKALNALDVFKNRREIQDKLTKIEGELRNAATLSPDGIMDVRRRIDEVDKDAAPIGPEFVARVGAAKQTADRTLADALHAEARTAASTASSPEAQRLALTKYTRAEEEINKLLDAAIKKQDKDSDAFFRKHFQEVIAESDALAKSLFTDDYVEKVVWRDLVSNDAKWNVAELAYKIDKDQMTIVGSTNANSGAGVMSAGDLEKWRDFVLDMEFTIVKGKFELYYRLGPNVDYTVWSTAFSSNEDDNVNYSLAQGDSHALTVKFIGSDFKIDMEGYDPTEPEAVPWSKSRKGAIGIVVPPGSELKVTRMRIRVLRP